MPNKCNNHVTVAKGNAIWLHWIRIPQPCAPRATRFRRPMWWHEMLPAVHGVLVHKRIGLADSYRGRGDQRPYRHPKPSGHVGSDSQGRLYCQPFKLLDQMLPGDSHAIEEEPETPFRDSILCKTVDFGVRARGHPALVSFRYANMVHSTPTSLIPCMPTIGQRCTFPFKRDSSYRLGPVTSPNVCMV